MTLRIIGGSLKKKKLRSIKGKKIRPTANRIKESIFNILSYRVANCDVLDLFAGTGSLGIEALSRGAKSAVFIDNNKYALSLINQNIQLCSLFTSTKIIKLNIVKGIKHMIQINPKADLVFMDPPYDKNIIEPTLYNLHNSSYLVCGAIIVVEHSTCENIANQDSHFSITDQRKYGKTVVSFLKYML